MARVESEFDVDKDLPEFLSSELDRTEEYISSNETNIKDLQTQFVVLDRTVSLLSSIASDIEQDRIEWESLESKRLKESLFRSTTGYRKSHQNSGGRTFINFTT